MLFIHSLSQTYQVILSLHTHTQRSQQRLSNSPQRVVFPVQFHQKAVCCSSLSFSHQRIHTFPRLLRSQKLSALPWSFGSMASLTELEIDSSYSFSCLPESLGNLSALEKLTIYGTKIRILPESIGSLRQLTHLSIAYSDLTVLPESIGSLEQLSFLIIASNDLRALPASFGNLISLTALYVLLFPPPKLSLCSQFFNSGTWAKTSSTARSSRQAGQQTSLPSAYIKKVREQLPFQFDFSTIFRQYAPSKHINPRARVSRAIGLEPVAWTALLRPSQRTIRVAPTRHPSSSSTALILSFQSLPQRRVL